MRGKKQLPVADENYLEQIANVEKPNGNYFCCICKDTGFVLDESENAKGIAKICDCSIKRMWHKAFVAAGVSVEMLDKSVESDWNTSQDAYGNDLGTDRKHKIAIGNFVTKYIKCLPGLIAGEKMTIEQKGGTNRKINSLLLIGGVKSGKSLLASIIVQEAIKKGISAKIYNWLDIRRLIHAYDLKEERESFFYDFINLDLFVIDGIQSIKDMTKNESNVDTMRDYAVLELDRLCARRLTTGKPTIITSDISYPEVSNGNNWINLVDSCYKIKLPSPLKPEKGVLR